MKTRSLAKGVLDVEKIKIKRVAFFKSKFVTEACGTVCVRFDFDSFFEWYKFEEDSFSIIEAEKAAALEASLHEFETLKNQNVVYLDNV